MKTISTITTTENTTATEMYNGWIMIKVGTEVVAIIK